METVATAALAAAAAVVVQVVLEEVEVALGKGATAPAAAAAAAAMVMVVAAALLAAGAGGQGSPGCQSFRACQSRWIPRSRTDQQAASASIHRHRLSSASYASGTTNQVSTHSPKANTVSPATPRTPCRPSPWSCGCPQRPLRPHGRSCTQRTVQRSKGPSMWRSSLRINPRDSPAAPQSQRDPSAAEPRRACKPWRRRAEDPLQDLF